MDTKVYFHGELIIIERDRGSIDYSKLQERRLPEDLKLADSETTRNHHMLQVIPGVHVFQDLEDMERFFVRPEVETKIYCALENRHTDLQLRSGCDYEIFPAQEYDHVEQARRKVAD